MAALWLILATIFAHALLPIGSPISRTSGSAFSASTAEVSLAPVRSGTSALLARHDDGSNAGLGGSDPPRPPVALLAVPASGPVFAPDVSRPQPAVAEPSPRPAKTRPYAPRAPPLF